VPVSTPAERLGPDQVGGIYYRDDLVSEPFQTEAGSVAVPDAPGLGWKVDEAKIERYRIRPR
jgi:muconate cycloisomerase